MIVTGSLVLRIEDEKVITVTSIRPISMWPIGVDEDDVEVGLPPVSVPGRYKEIE